MVDLIKGTTYVLGDEFCVNLAEVNLISPEDHQWHRFEIILLYRDGHLVEYRHDMGFKDDFKADQFRIMGGVVDGNKVYQEHTVNELREMADDMRENPSFDKRELVQSDKIKI